MNEHDSLDHPHPDIGWSLAGLASQPKLGLWSKRIVEHRSRRPVDTVADGANLEGSRHRIGGRLQRKVISQRSAGTSHATIGFNGYHR